MKIFEYFKSDFFSLQARAKQREFELDSLHNSMFG